MDQEKRRLFERHLSDGELRAHIDRPAGAGRAEQHLQTCPTCRERVEALADRARRIESRLNDLDPAREPIIKTHAARAMLEMRLQQTEEPSMFKKLTQRVSRPVWAALALVAVLSVAMAFPPVRAAASSFLQLFRVEQVRIVPVDMNSFSTGMESSAQFEALFAENLELEENGEPQETTDAAEAAALAGITLRLPAEETPEVFMVQPGGTATFTVDLELARAVLREVGRAEVALPDELDGAKIKIEIPSGVVALLGECRTPRRDPSDLPRQPGEDWDRCSTLTQLPSPSVSAPPDMDIAALGKIYMQVLGMTESQAALFASNVDWATTFVVPIPREEAEYAEVTVDGVSGTLITFGKGYRPSYTLLWVKDGMVYVLSGSGKADKALQIAATIQ